MMPYSPIYSKKKKEHVKNIGGTKSKEKHQLK
jgi:hypothetical protein